MDRMLDEDSSEYWEKLNKNMNKIFENIVKSETQLRELKTYQEHKANGDITEAVLVCNPKVSNILREVISNNKLEDIPIVATPLAEEDKIYMVTDKEFIKNARKMLLVT